MNVPELKLFKIAEHLYKAVVNHINRFIVVIDIAEHCLQAIAIILFIEGALVPLIVLNAAGYEYLKIQSEKVNGKYGASVKQVASHLIKLQIVYGLQWQQVFFLKHDFNLKWVFTIGAMVFTL